MVPLAVCRLALIAIFIVACDLCSHGADAGPKPPSDQDPALAPVADIAGLPRVLLIGDSISIGYTLPVRDLLRGKANVHRIPDNAGTTRTTLQNFAQWIGSGHWEVIHFNWGLHDLKRLPDGSRQIGPVEYERNLRELVARLRPLADRLIWCSTTPVPGTELDPPRRNEDVIAYNGIARRVMAESGVAVDDLYAFVLPQADRIRKPLNVHFTPKGSQILARQVTRCLLQALPASAPAPSAP